MIVISFKDFLHNYDGFLLIFSKSVKLELKKCFFSSKNCSDLKLIGIVIFRFIMARKCRDSSFDAILVFVVDSCLISMGSPLVHCLHNSFERTVSC